MCSLRRNSILDKGGCWNYMRIMTLVFLYNLGKANAVADSLSRLFIGSTFHVEEGKRELAKDVHRLDRLGVCLMDSTIGGIVVTNRAESSLVSGVKEKQDQDPILLDLKENVLGKEYWILNMGDGVLDYVYQRWMNSKKG